MLKDLDGSVFSALVPTTYISFLDCFHFMYAALLGRHLTALTSLTSWGQASSSQLHVMASQGLHPRTPLTLTAWALWNTEEESTTPSLCIFHAPKAHTTWMMLPSSAANSGWMYTSLDPRSSSFYLLLLSRSRNHSRLSFPHQLSWVQFCPEGTLPFIQVQSRPLLSGINLLNNYSPSSSQSLSLQTVHSAFLFVPLSLYHRPAKALWIRVMPHSALCSMSISSGKEITTQFS